MLKYVDTKVVFSEIPDEITLAINLSNCPCHCPGCHSSYLAEDIGKVLTYYRIEKLLEQNKGVTAICFMGGDNDPKLINHYAGLIKKSYIEQMEAIYKMYGNRALSGEDSLFDNSATLLKFIPNPIKVGWYSGRQKLAKEIDLENFSFIKLGPYQEDRGPLNNPNTNQRFYQVIDGKLVDITNKFWKHEIKD